MEPILQQRIDAARKKGASTLQKILSALRRIQGFLTLSLPPFKHPSF